MLTKESETEYAGIEYTEHREYIKDKKKGRRRLFGERYPKEPAEQIRYYYRKLLDKLKKEDIEIRKQDTSLDVNNKAIDRFGDEIKDMRKLYIDSRYGDGKVDKETVEKMKTLYKNI